MISIARREDSEGLSKKKPVEVIRDDSNSPRILPYPCKKCGVVLSRVRWNSKHDMIVCNNTACISGFGKPISSILSYSSLSAWPIKGERNGRSIEELMPQTVTSKEDED